MNEAQATEIRSDRVRPRAVGPGGAPDRRYHELCVLSELCGQLRAADVWLDFNSAQKKQH
jgi:hypothetical protein